MLSHVLYTADLFLIALLAEVHMQTVCGHIQGLSCLIIKPRYIIIQPRCIY